MYSRSVNFADSASKDVIVRLARGLNITRSGGTGVVILSTITGIGQAQCDAAGLAGYACTNLNQNVFTDRIVIGNPAARASAFGTPTAGLIDANGNVAAQLTDVNARAHGFSAVLALNPGELAYVAEVYVPSPDYALPGYLSTGVYCRTVF
jgi:hypothetical protein